MKKNTALLLVAVSLLLLNYLDDNVTVTPGHYLYGKYQFFSFAVWQRTVDFFNCVN